MTSEVATMPHTPIFTQLIYTAKETAALLADSDGKEVVSADWLTRKAITGEIDCSLIGRFIRFSPANIMRLITDGVQPPGTYNHKKR